jgi:hypothetical protein
LALAVLLSTAACSKAADSTPPSFDASAADAMVDSTVVDPPRDADRPETAEDEPVAPWLTKLAVLANPGLDGSVGTLLTPSFSPGVHDYYVPCVAGTNVLVVSIAASPGAVASLSQPVVTTPTPTQTLSVGVVEGRALVALATEGAASTAYWVRCLPHDFPTMTWEPHPEAGAPPPGYYLVGNVLAAESGGYAMVLDVHGVPVWYAPMGAGLGAMDVDSLAAGEISFVLLPSRTRISKSSAWPRRRRRPSCRRVSSPTRTSCGCCRTVTTSFCPTRNGRESI